MAEGEPEKKGGGDDGARGGAVAYAAGLTIFFSVLSFMGLGWLLDRWLGTGWIMVVGILVGSAVGFYEFIRIMSRFNK